MELTYHNSYAILGVMTNTVIFWTELSCWHKNYSNKATLPLGWSHRYNTSTVVIRNWLIVTKYQFLKRQCIYFLVCVFISLLYHWQIKRFPDLTIWIAWRVSYQKQELLTFRKHPGSPIRACGEVSVAHLFRFLCSFFRSNCNRSASCFRISILDCPVGFLKHSLKRN